MINYTLIIKFRTLMFHANKVKSLMIILTYSMCCFSTEKIPAMYLLTDRFPAVIRPRDPTPPASQ